MMWQLKPCMSQEFPPILQIFHCPVSLSPLHAVILLLCMCVHTDDAVLIRVRAHLEVFVERCVSQPQSEHRCEFVVVWNFEVDLDDHAASRLSSADGSFSPRSSRGVSGVVHLRSVLKSMERSACQLMWVKLLTVVCVLLLFSRRHNQTMSKHRPVFMLSRWFLCRLSQTEPWTWVVSQTLKQKSPLQL